MTRIRAFYWAVQVVALAALSTSAFAQATRTWISGVGDDANPCSRTAPCKTIAGAISKTATAGEINNIDAGGFGAVTITKSITIDLTPGLGGVLVAGTSGIVISNTTGSAMSVILRGIDFDGIGGSGLSGVVINGTSPVTVHIEDSKIYGFSENGINITNVAGANVTVVRTRISECTGSSTSGIHADATAGPVNVTIVDSEVHDCAVGLSLAMGAKANARLSDFSQNATGVSASDTSNAALDSGAISYCTTGVSTLSAGAKIYLTNMTIAYNTTGLSSTAGAILSFGNNRIKANATNGAPTSMEIQN